MKRLVICCDGTWNKIQTENETNVLQVAHSILGTDADGVKQLIHYQQGVGTGSGATTIARQIDRLGGGAFGWGLTDNAAACYKFLVFNYEIGDQIYIFGFSRGAYTARSLAGLIRTCSILTPENIGQFDRAIELYRNRNGEDGPDKLEIQEFRSEFAPGLTVSDKDDEWRAQNAPEQVAAGILRLRLTYLGVWDTVGALGIPNNFSIAQFFNKKYQFHDHALSRSVEAARHAVAIDEHRTAFEPTLWDNIDDLNKGGGVQPYRQLWFPGDHGSVGGGGANAALSAEAMRWVVEGAVEKGLPVRPSFFGHVERTADHRGPINASPKKAGLFGSFTEWAGTGDREGPSHIRSISEFARRRWREPAANLPGGSAYRPKTLGAVASALDQTDNQ